MGNPGQLLCAFFINVRIAFDSTMAAQKEGGTSVAAPITPENPLTGRCFCGSITYTLSAPPAPPLWSYLCHCLDCRRFSGTSFAHNATFDDSALKIRTSAADSLDQVLSTFGEEKTGTRQFCRKCGSPLFLRTGEKIENMIGKVIVAVGTIEGSEKDERLKPGAEGWCKRREAWMGKAEGATESDEW